MLNDTNLVYFLKVLYNMDSKSASRKLGYGFSSEYQEIPLSEFVVNAKTELETVPKFDPWSSFQ